MAHTFVKSEIARCQGRRDMEGTALLEDIRAKLAHISSKMAPFKLAELWKDM